MSESEPASAEPARDARNYPDYILSEADQSAIEASVRPFGECKEAFAFTQQPEVHEVFALFGELNADTLIGGGCHDLAYWQKSYEDKKAVIASGEAFK